MRPGDNPSGQPRGFAEGGGGNRANSCAIEPADAVHGIVTWRAGRGLILTGSELMWRGHPRVPGGNGDGAFQLGASVVAMLLAVHSSAQRAS